MFSFRPIQGIHFSSWFRKKHPRTPERVNFPPHPEGGDILRSMTVIPYLEALHNPASPSLDQDNAEFEDIGTYTYAACGKCHNLLSEFSIIVLCIYRYDL